jgi:hypothetical protein
MKNSYRKQNILNEDINRMREIMGLFPLNEQMQNLFAPIFKSLRGTVRKILNPSIEEIITQNGVRTNVFKIAGRSVPEDVYNMYYKLLNAEGDEFMRAYQQFTNKIGNETEEMFRGRIRSLLQTLGDDYANEFYNEFMKSWFKQTSDLFPDALKSEKAFYRWMSNARKKAFSEGREWNLSDWLRGVGLVDDTFDLETLLPTFEKRLKEFDENPLNFKTRVVKKAPGKVVPLSEPRINYLKRFLGKRNTLFTSIFKSWGKTLQDYESTVLGYMEAYADDVIRASKLPAEAQKETLDTLSAAYAQQVSIILRKAKLKFGDDAIQILEDSGLPDDIVAHFRNNQDDFFKYFNECFASAKSSVRTNIWESVVSAGRNFIKTISKFLLDVFTLKWKTIVKDLLNPETNIGTWFWTQSWSGFDTLYQIAAKNKLLSKNPRFWSALGEGVVWTSVASAAGFILSVGGEIFKEFVIKPIGKIITEVCEMISVWVPSLMYKVNPDTGVAEEGWCPYLAEQSEMEREGWSAITMAIPDGFADALRKSIVSKGYAGIIATALPVVAQAWGFVANLPYTIGAFRPDIKPIIGKSEEKQKELKKVTEEESNGEVNADNIKLPDADSVALELEQQ